jgi:type II secretory pathway predicted ATPase ExeA
MYETHFGLRRRPFRATPDSGCYYPATPHESALEQLLAALAEGEGMVLVTGAPGTGKTLLCHRLIERLGAGVTNAFLPHGRYGGRAGLLRAILYDLSRPHEAAAETDLRLALADFLLANYAAGKKAVLVLDEAHHLGPDLLEELRLLGNLEAEGGKALQVVLVGEPSFLATLGRPVLSSLGQRLAVRVVLEPMIAEEAADYILHQLRAVGGTPQDLISPEALELLAHSTHGVPRLLNQAAHRALSLACTAGERMVDAEAVVEALAALGLDSPEEPVPTENAAGSPEDVAAPAETDLLEWRLTVPKPAAFPLPTG